MKKYPIFISKQLTPRQWKNCFKKYESNEGTKKTLISEFLSLSFYWVFLNQDIKITYKSRRNPQLELMMMMAFHTNKNIYGRKRITKYIEQNNNIKVSDRTIGNYLGALGFICIARQVKRRKEKKILRLNMMI